jgi:uncharacterized protein
MFESLIQKICRSSTRRPFIWLLISVALSVPAALEVRSHLRLNTDLMRLLPEESPAVVWGRELRDSVGDGGVFTILFEGDDPVALRSALEAAAREVSALPQVQSVAYRYPVDFVRRYGYLLVPSEALRSLLDVLVSWKAEASPLGLKLESGPVGSAPGTREEGEIRAALELFARQPEVHQSSDGRIVGMLVAPKEGVTSLGATRDLLLRLERITDDVAQRHDLWGGVAGTLRNKVDTYVLVMRDLNAAGIVALVGIIAVLALSFRSLMVVPVLLYPLGLGLLWSFAMIPTLVGELNTITAFLLMILFGMGVDYAIHLVKRFQVERERQGLEGGLLETFRSTGRSVVTSALTTAVGMAVLALSSFRGFSDYGIISGTSMVLVLAAFLLVLPATLVAGAHLGAIPPVRLSKRGRVPVTPIWATALLVALVAGGTLLAIPGLRFDYDFSELQSEAQDAALVKQKQREVYPGSLTPGALYVARDLDALDETLARLRALQADPDGGAIVGKLSSLRDMLPLAAEAAERRLVLAELQERLSGRWIRHVKDDEKRRWIEAARDFTPPPSDARFDELPPELLGRYQARDGSGELMLGVYPNGERKNGRLAMAFDAELRRIELPDGVRGPTGETLILSEILGLVTGEGPWLVALTLLGIFLVILWDTRGSVRQTCWILLPLGAGMMLTLGAMVALGWKLNFFNMIVLPNLLGLWVDAGVHYYRRWIELGGDTREAQLELFEPLTGATLTTIVGYSGMMLAHHQGLRSIGMLAGLGLFCGWVAALWLLPGLLRLMERRPVIEPATPAWYEPALGEPQVSS